MPVKAREINTTFSTVSPVEMSDLGGSENNNNERRRTTTIEPITTIGQPPDVAPLHPGYVDSVWLKVSSDIIVLLLFGGIIGGLVGAYEPYKRGFNCDDESIRYPYRSDTVTPLMLLFYPTIIMAATIIVNELFILEAHCGYSLSVQSKKMMVTHISKYTIGRLRPHFIDVCRPKIVSSGVILNRFSACPNNSAIYYVDYECTGEEVYPYQLVDAHLSFMSGHSSHIASSMVYLMMYLQARFRWPGLDRVKHALQTVLFSVAFWVALTRISDYKHHWSDVLVGFLQGAIFSILVALYCSSLFKFDSNRSSNRSQNHTSPIHESAVSINMSV